MSLKNVENLILELEQTELEAADGCPPQTYAKLLALYLYENDMCNAKYLWKRIPKNVQSNSTELKNIWNVGQKMWQRDWEAVHAALNIEWNANVSEIMNALKQRTYERAVSLISEAYSSLDIMTLSKMTGLSVEQAQQLVLDKGWAVNGTIVKPVKTSKQQSPIITETTTEDQLHKLTQFVSFLEN